MGFSVGWKYFAHDNYYCHEAVQERRKLEQKQKQAEEKRAQKRKAKLEKKKADLRAKEEVNKTDTLDAEYAKCLEQFDAGYGDKPEPGGNPHSSQLRRGFGFGSSAGTKKNKSLSTHGYQPPNPRDKDTPANSAGSTKTESKSSAGFAPRLRRPF